MNISEIMELQRSFFHSGATLPLSFRRAMLDKLYRAIQKHEADIYAALQQDLGKSDYESLMCEIGLTLSEITYMRRHLRSLAREKRVATPLAQFAARSYTKPSPYGNVLIMSPWNYPFLLTVEPLVDAIAAGNTAVVKPSAYSPATSAVVEKLIAECFEPQFVSVVSGGRAENSALLEQKFDLIFFTGSQAVGREVLRHAAEYLTPSVLELGGKSPCIVDETADIALAARRIVFGKFLNCGQTCVAPDHILCHSSIKDELAAALCAEIKRQYGENPLADPDYGRIVNGKHFERLFALLDGGKTLIGGGYAQEKLQIEPTVLDDITDSDAVMQQEIFGPILPILTYERFEDIYARQAALPKPLALYIFSQDKERIKEATARLSYGGGCINDTIIHLATSAMPFGGVGESGMGGYHGRAGFEAFSHCKAIVDKKLWIDLPMRYQPYDRKKYAKMLRMFLK